MADPATTIREALTAYAARDHCTCPQGADGNPCAVCGKPESVNVPALAALTELKQQLAARSHRCVFPACVDGDKPEFCGHCGDAERADAAERERDQLAEAVKLIPAKWQAVVARAALDRHTRP